MGGSRGAGFMIIRTRRSRWRGSSESLPLLFVDFSAVADAEDEDDQAFVFERANNAVVADTVSPEFAQSPLESLANLARVVELPDSFVEKLGNTPRDGFIESVELSLGSW